MRTHPNSSPHHAFMYVWILGAVLVFAGLGVAYVMNHPQGVLDGEHEGDVRALVLSFSNQMDTVSLLAPNAADTIRSVYAPYVAPALIEEWARNPETAPGRLTSSPWPDHIEIASVTKEMGDRYAVTGTLVLMASTDEAGTVPVSLTVENTEGGYLITAYSEERAPAQIEAGPVEVTAGIGESRAALGVTITPTKVLEDSRCPIDVQCIQAGRVRVEAVLVDGMGTSTLEFSPGTVITAEAVSVTLVSVVPETKTSTVPVTSADYRFMFRIERR